MVTSYMYLLAVATLSSLTFTACSLKLHQFETMRDFLDRPLAREESDTIYVIDSEHIKQIRSLLSTIQADQEAIVDNLGLRLAFDDVAGFRGDHSLILQDHVVNALKKCGYDVLEPETLSDQVQEILGKQRLILDGLMLHSERMFVGGLGPAACPGESIVSVNQIIRNTALYDRMSDAEKAAQRQQVNVIGNRNSRAYTVNAIGIEMVEFTQGKYSASSMQNVKKPVDVTKLTNVKIMLKSLLPTVLGRRRCWGVSACAPTRCPLSQWQPAFMITGENCNIAKFPIY